MKKSTIYHAYFNLTLEFVKLLMLNFNYLFYSSNQSILLFSLKNSQPNIHYLF